MTAISKFFRDEDGAALIEYGLLAALISVVAVAAINRVGVSVTEAFEAVADELENAVNLTAN